MENFYHGKSVFITGGSSGIGLALAEQLAAYGAHVTILARRPDVLEKARKLIQNGAQKSVIVQALSADVADIGAIKNAVSEASQKAGTPDLLINSAGIAHPGEFYTLGLETFQSMMQINYFGSLHAIQAVLPHMLERGSGVIVNISSAAGYLNIYGYTAYGASKYAVAGFSEALRMELKPQGIHVSLVFPPDTDTPQLEYDNQYKPHVTRVLGGSAGSEKPEKVAHEILRGVQKKQFIIVPGLENKLIYSAVNLLGRSLVHRILDQMVARALKDNPTTKK